MKALLAKIFGHCRPPTVGNDLSSELRRAVDQNVTESVKGAHHVEVLARIFNQMRADIAASDKKAAAK